MTLTLVRDDITRVTADAIVTSTDPSFSGSGGADQRIHQAAGTKLDAVCRELKPCSTGEVRVTEAFRLPAKYVIHAVSPMWRGGSAGERELLAQTYRAALRAAVEKKCASAAFPLLSSGTFGFPKELAFRIAVDTIRAFLLENDDDLRVILVVFDPESTAIGLNYDSGLRRYIDDRYVSVAMPPNLSARSFAASKQMAQKPFRREKSAEPVLREMSDLCCDAMATPAPTDLSDALSKLDESFTQMLLRKIDESGMTDAECYKKANVDRKLFSKIRKDPAYRPSKPTALAFAVALRLPLDETKSLLQKAGYALSGSYKFDVILEYFISNGVYDVFTINEALFACDQSLLGG